MAPSDRAARIAKLKAFGAKVQGDMITLYRGADVQMDILKKLRYGDYLSASEEGDDASGNAGAASYGKNVVRFCLSVDDVIVTGAGEYQFKGKSKSLSDGVQYPASIYRAYNDAYGSNYTAREIDAQDNVRAVASQALAGGREEFDALLEQHTNQTAKLGRFPPAEGNKDVPTPPQETHPTSLGENLWRRLQQEPIGDTMRWLEDNHPDMITRLRRLTVIDDEYRLDKLWAIVPPEELRKLPEIEHTTSIWRGVPKGAKIRPGDWVSLSRSYAEAHGDRTTDHASVDSLGRVECSDIYWAGTDMNEFFYLPKAWRGDGRTEAEHLQSLSRDMVLSFADGELSAFARHEPRLDAIRAQVEEAFDEEACGELHGPDHWHRVSYHAVAASRALGISPLVPHVFALVHDSQREHDGFDLEHGPRAAQFIRERRHDLFDFLDDEQIDHLTLACTEHSNGVTEGPAYAQACWDADRLDLGRVGVCPEPRYLCTDYARRPEIIREALTMSGAAHLIDELDCEQSFGEQWR